MASSFSRQRNPNMEKALFDWPIVLQYDVKEISRKFFGHEVCLPARSLSQPKPRCVCIRFIHQSNRSISVRLLFLFCSRVFISRSYENRSNELSESLVHLESTHPGEDVMWIPRWRNCWIKNRQFPDGFHKVSTLLPSYP